jgi:hypothetical protein
MIHTVLALVLLACAAPQVFAQRTYWHATIAQLAAGGYPHTHAELDSVVVDYVHAEADSDFHIRLRDPKDTVPSHFVVAECVPELPCRHPKLGETISVRGITRRDAEHGWAEIHAVEWMSPVGKP